MSTMYWLLFIGDTTVNKIEKKISVFCEIIVFQNECLTFKVISCCIILFCILKVGYYFILCLQSFSEKFFLCPQSDANYSDGLILKKVEEIEH